MSKPHPVSPNPVLPSPISPEQTHFVRDHCLCLASQRAARALSRRFDERFRALGITSGQFSLLNALNRPVPPSIGSVADLLVMDRTSLTANLKPMPIWTEVHGEIDGVLASGSANGDILRAGLAALL